MFAAPHPPQRAGMQDEVGRQGPVNRCLGCDVGDCRACVWVALEVAFSDGTCVLLDHPLPVDRLKCLAYNDHNMDRTNHTCTPSRLHPCLHSWSRTSLLVLLLVVGILVWVVPLRRAHSLVPLSPLLVAGTLLLVVGILFWVGLCSWSRSWPQAFVVEGRALRHECGPRGRHWRSRK